MIERLSALRELSGAQSYISIPAGDGGSARSDAAERISFDDMHGQPTVKWACAVSAAGFHNVMLMGPPGSGKTMAARRVATLLPDLDPSESREVARLYSMRGLEASIPSPRPPMRMPHHGATMEGLLGGGRFKVPGEVSLSHRGVMILDEAAEFRPRVLQALREPVERRFVDVSRAGRADRFPSAFQLVMTSNLCPCGKLGRPGSRCMCSLQEVERYWRRLGAALLDRVELRVRTHYHESSQESPPHAELTDRVHAAVERQRRRYRAVRWKRNGLVPAEAGAAPIGLSETLDALLRSEMASRDLSDRAAAAVRRVARTIADIDDREDVQEGDVLEALALRCAAPD
jgi:magnesium chelatase family protein